MLDLFYSLLLSPCLHRFFESCNNLQQENSILLPGGIQPYGFNQGRLAWEREVSAAFLCQTAGMTGKAQAVLWVGAELLPVRRAVCGLGECIIKCFPCLLLLEALSR